MKPTNAVLAPQGTAKQAKGAAANLVAFWLVGLPLGEG